MDPNNQFSGNDDSSLELDSQSASAVPAPSPPQKSLVGRIRWPFARLNIYLVIFILIMVIASIGMFVVWRQQTAEDGQVASDPLQTLSQETLDQLRSRDASLGDARQTLTVNSNSVFEGRVLIRDSLDVAGVINVGAGLNLPEVNVSGASIFNTAQVASDLTVGGNTSVLGSLIVQAGINVTGGGSFGGPLTVPALDTGSLGLSGDLTLNRHINTSGGVPAIAGGGAIGGGGTVSISGSDTAGTIVINTGGGPSAGNLATVSFAASFGDTPRVILSPSSPAAAAANAYVDRSTSSFVINATDTPPGNATLIFDFIALE